MKKATDSTSTLVIFLLFCGFSIQEFEWVEKPQFESYCFILLRSSFIIKKSVESQLHSGDHFQFSFYFKQQDEQGSLPLKRKSLTQTNKLIDCKNISSSSKVPRFGVMSKEHQKFFHEFSEFLEI